VRELRSLVRSLGNDEVALLSGSYLNDPGNILQRGVVERYVEQCSYKLDQQVISNLLGPENRLTILKAIGPSRRAAATVSAPLSEGIS